MSQTKEKKPLFPIPSDRKPINNEDEYRERVKDLPETILEEYAKSVTEYTKTLFEGLLVIANTNDTWDTSVDADKIVYSLYILSTKYGDIMYRLIETSSKNIGVPYPVTVRLLGLSADKINESDCINVSQLRERLDDYLSSETTEEVLGYLANLIKNKDYKHSRSDQ